MQKQWNLENFCPVSGVKPYPQETIYFCRKRI